MQYFTKQLLKRNYITFGACIFVVLFVAMLFSSVVLRAPRASADVAGTFSGYAWSDTIGWISLNCSNDSSCATSTYGLSVASDGVISGYAWSENVGWISANSTDLAGCPSGTCEARTTSGSLSGWLKVLAGGSDGWDGFISLSGAGYGVTQSNGVFAGYAWGDMNVGWVDFSPAIGICTPVYSCSGVGNNTIMYKNAQCQTSTIATCTSPGFCSSGISTCQFPVISFVPFTGSGGGSYDGHISVRPQIITKGATAKVFWSVTNVTSCTVTGSDGEHWVGTSSGTSGTTTTPINQQTTFTLACQGINGATPPSIAEIAVVNIVPTFLEK